MHAQTRALIRMITFIKLINMLVYFTLNRESLHQQEVVVIQTGKYVDTQIQFLRTATKLFLRAQMDEPCKRMHAKTFGKNLNVFVPITNSLYQYYCYLKNIVLLLTISRGGSKITSNFVYGVCTRPHTCSRKQYYQIFSNSSPSSWGNCNLRNCYNCHRNKLLILHRV